MTLIEDEKQREWRKRLLCRMQMNGTEGDRDEIDISESKESGKKKRGRITKMELR